ncbi:hypothetical protein [Chryseobacterium jejuense]|uniref:Uncharacterized protein n=1 Tax=Chryseobacterium jejuense TaxID=445960 RepID=A0A2X2Z8X7_CHRJE|nr:hypothetical protein [Chryseobacterium jejuense]SDJ57475.1 hypothetical protein SAMN05421542_3857 [Chryseobacterium jejuense]SQB46149.1 Uncharacterised protein [Chryseobacterium jejuense]
MKIQFLFVLLFNILYINAQKSLSETMHLRLFSSREKSFEVIISPNSNEIKFSAEKTVYLADSINSETTFFKKMDSTRVNLIKNHIQTDDIFYKLVNSQTRNKLYNSIKKLNTCKTIINNKEQGLIYIAYSNISIKKNRYCQYTFDSKNDYPNDKILFDLLSEIEKIFPDNSVVKSYINSTRVYFKNSSIKIVSPEPLLIKLYKLPPYHYPIYTSCEKLAEEINQLPVSNQIFIDITEYTGNFDQCVISLLSKKYKHLRWIQNNMFDTFNSIENISPKK